MGCCFQNLGSLAEWRPLLIAYLKLKQRPIPLSVSAVATEACCLLGAFSVKAPVACGASENITARPAKDVKKEDLVWGVQLKYACWSMTWRYLQHLGSEARWHMHFCTWGHVAFFFVLADFCSFQKWPLKESLREYFQEYNWFFTFF